MPGSVQGPDNTGGGNPSALPKTEKKEVPKQEIISILSADGEKFSMPMAEIPNGSIFTAHTKSGDRKICVATGEKNTFSCESGLKTTQELEAEGLQPTHVNLAARLEAGGNFDKTFQALLNDNSKHRRDIQLPGNEKTITEFYETRGKGKPEKLIATYVQEKGKDAERRLILPKLGEFGPDADGNIKKL